MLKPGHPEDHGVNPDWGNVKDMALGNASDRNVEGNLVIRVHENMIIGEDDANRRTWFGGYSKE